MKRARTTLTAAIALTAIAGSTLGVAALGAEPVTFVTGTRVENTEANPGNFREGDGVGHVEGIRHEQTIEWSDPRLPSLRVVTSNADIIQPADPAAVPFVSIVLLDGAEGSWTGTAVGYFEGAFLDFVGTNTLVGHGEYEGLSAVLYESPATDAEGLTVFEGIIFEGALPAMPQAHSVE